MADKTLNVRVKHKYDTEANWKNKNPVLLQGEIGFINDGRYKVGNGTSKWNDLPYAYDNYLLKKTTHREWTTNIKCATWSRLCYVGYKVNVTGSAFILNVSATRNSVVYNDTLVIKVHYSQKALITKISGCDYSTVTYRVVSDSSGNCYVELNDSANKATNATIQSVRCTFTDIDAGSLTTYNAFTDGTTVPNNFIVSAILTTNKNSLQGNLTWDEVTGKPSTFAPSLHTHTISQVTNLQSALDGKSNTNHSHSYVPLAGGTMTGNLAFSNNKTGISWARVTDGASILFNAETDATDNYLEFHVTDDEAVNFKWTKTVGSENLTLGTWKREGIRLGVGSFIGSLTGNVYGNVYLNASQSVIQNQRDDSNYTSSITWKKGGKGWYYKDSNNEDKKYTYDPQIGQHNTGNNGDGSIVILPYATNTSPWGGEVGLYIGKNNLKLDGNNVLHTGNYNNYSPTKTGGGASGNWGISITGNAASATSASKLTTNAGSAIQPIYFSNGVPVSCTYTLGKSVPSNAKFTDTNTWRPVENVLNSTSTSNSLSAAQGKVLNDLTFQKRSSIDASTDWNTLKNIGCYKVQITTWGDASTKHGPNNYSANIYSYGLLLVFRATDSDTENRTIQIYIPHKDDNAVSSIILTRMLNGSTWNSWHPLTRGTRWTDLLDKPSTYAPSPHTHDDRYYTESEINSKLATKSNNGHTHDDRYYTESEINSKLSGKSNTNHTHDLSTMINALSTASATPTDNDYYIAQYAGGGNTTTSYYRRSHSALWNYIKSKSDSVYQPKGSYAASSHTHAISDITNLKSSLDSKLSLSGGTITGQIKRNAGGNWISDRDHAAVFNTRSGGDSYQPVVGQKTAVGSWTIGSLASNESLVFNYCTDANYKAGNNASEPIYLPPQAGTIITSATIGGQSVNYANSAGKLSTSRTISLTGSVTGSGSFDGSGNLAITTSTNHTHSYVTDINNNAHTTFAYSKAGMNYADYTWLAAWNGNELRAINKSQFATAGHGHAYLPLAGGTLTGKLNIQGAAADKPLQIRGIVGSDGSTTVGELYLQYGVDKPIYLGNTANYYISADGGQYTGNAATATALTSSAGSTTQPIYFSGGKPVACSYTLAKSVPADAKFTDTNTWRGIQNNLTSTATDQSLSAAQGKWLKENKLGAVNANGYWGMAKPDGTTADWIRTTSNGIIPYQSGGSGNGHSRLGTSSWYFSEAYIDTIYGKLSGNASTATKLQTARTVSGGTDITVNFSYDGSGNSSASIGYYSCYASVGNTNNYPYHRFAKLDSITGSHVDKTMTVYISQDFNGGAFGIARISLRTNNVSNKEVSSAEVKWLIRSGISADAIQIGLYNVAGATYADAFIKLQSGYYSTVIRAIANGARGGISRTWTLVNSAEANSTTSSDYKTSSECYVNIATAGTKLHNRAYTNTVSGSDAGTASSANSLTTARSINGTNFNGSGNITTANWGTARTITIGNSGKSVNGSGNVSWSLSEIGAAAASHTHTSANITDFNTRVYDATLSRTANTVLAAPNGSNGSATFRKLVAADLPSHTHNYAGSSSAGGNANWANGATYANYAIKTQCNPTENKKDNGLFMFQYSGNTTICPDGGWWSVLRTQHAGYDNGYWQEVAYSFSGDTVKFRRNVNGTKSAWKTFAWTDHTHNYAGSSSAGGAATSANKLNTNAGSATQPVYFSNGVPTACTYTLGKSVPSDAKFTDTNTWRGIQNNLTSDSTSDSLSAAQGKALKGLIDGKAASGHTHNYLPLSGGTLTGELKLTSRQITFTSAPATGTDYLGYIGTGLGNHTHQSGILFKLDDLMFYGNPTFDGEANFSNSINVNGAIRMIDYSSDGAGDVNKRRPITSVAGDGLRVGWTKSKTHSNGKKQFCVNGQWGTEDSNGKPTSKGSWTTGYILIDSTSDVRLKKNIKNTDITALPIINQMKVRQFDWKETGIHQQLGLVADELDKFDPLLTVGGGYEADGSMYVKQIDRLLLTEYAIKGIQEQQDEIVELQKENEELKQKVSEIDALKEELAQLKALIMNK